MTVQIAFLGVQLPYMFVCICLHVHILVQNTGKYVKQIYTCLNKYVKGFLVVTKLQWTINNAWWSWWVKVLGFKVKVHKNVCKASFFWE